MNTHLTTYFEAIRTHQAAVQAANDEIRTANEAFRQINWSGETLTQEDLTYILAIQHMGHKASSDNATKFLQFLDTLVNGNEVVVFERENRVTKHTFDGRDQKSADFLTYALYFRIAGSPTLKMNNGVIYLEFPQCRHVIHDPCSGDMNEMWSVGYTVPSLSLSGSTSCVRKMLAGQKSMPIDLSCVCNAIFTAINGDGLNLDQEMQSFSSSDQTLLCGPSSYMTSVCGVNSVPIIKLREKHNGGELL